MKGFRMSRPRGRDRFLSHEEREGAFGEHFGGSPRRRIFEHGDMRYVILAILQEKPSYGYELIKAIEERLHGAYAPSPGLVYPTLTMLEEIGYAQSEAGPGEKKLYSITAEGKSFLQTNRTLVDAIFGRMAHAADLHRRSQSPQLVRAIQNLKLAIKLKSSASELSDQQVEFIASTLDEAARKIECC